MIASQPILHVTVRPLQGPDLDNGFLEVIQSFRPCSLTHGDAGSILRERIRRGLLAYVAECHGRIVGTASLLIDHKFINNGGKVAILEDVIVLPEYQGRGVGTQLMAAAQEKAVELGCYKICLYCSAELVRYYERLGFNQTDLFMRRDVAAD